VTVWTRSWVVIGIGLIVGLALRASLPPNRYLSFLWDDTFHAMGVPINRLAFWLCLAAAVVIAVALAAKRAAAS